MIVYRLETKKYLLVVNASNILKDWQWIVDKNKREDFYNTFKEFKTIIDSQKPDIFKVIATNSFRNLKDIDFIKTIENILNHEMLFLQIEVTWVTWDHVVGLWVC